VNIDENIIKSCIQQQRVAQNKLYTMLLPYLRAVAYRYLKDTSYTKDVLQEGFIKIFKNLNTYDSNKAPLKQWATRIIINIALNFNNRIIGAPKMDITSADINAFSTPKALRNMSNEHLLHVLKQMPENYFRVFNLHIIDGYNHQEIGDLLKISPELSRKRLFRARTWLKKTFHENPDLKTELRVLPFYLN